MFLVKLAFYTCRAAKRVGSYLKAQVLNLPIYNLSNEMSKMQIFIKGPLILWLDTKEI